MSKPGGSGGTFSPRKPRGSYEGRSVIADTDVLISLIKHLKQRKSKHGELAFRVLDFLISEGAEVLAATPSLAEVLQGQLAGEEAVTEAAIASCSRVVDVTEAAARTAAILVRRSGRGMTSDAKPLSKRMLPDALIAGVACEQRCTLLLTYNSKDFGPLLKGTPVRVPEDLRDVLPEDLFSSVPE